MSLWFLNLQEIISFGCMYYTIQLGRCVLFSVPVLLCIYMLRKTILRRCIFGRAVVWSVIVILPFLGKLHACYENPVFVKATFWWTKFCFEVAAVKWIYIGGVVVMAAFLLRKKYRLMRMIKRLPAVCCGGIKVYVGPEAVTPFTIGWIRHRIVVPEVFLQCMSEEELEVIVLHEHAHIRLGHLLIFGIWNGIRCLLWPNPLLIGAVKWLKADMENCCDTLCMHLSDMSAKEYGNLLLKSIRLLQESKEQGALYATFVGDKQFRNLKTRFQNIKRCCRVHQRHIAAMYILAFAVAVSTLASVKAVSYPRYSEDRCILVTNYNAAEQLLPDCEEVRSAIAVKENELLIDTVKMNELLRKYKVKEKRFFILFGGYTKLPNMGGACNGALVEYDETKNPLVVPFEENGWGPILKYM